MKKISKRFLSLALSIAISLGSFTVAYADTELKDYGNDFVTINVHDTYSKENTEGKLDIDILPKNDTVTVGSITFPDESKTINKDIKLQPKAEKVTKDHKYSYNVNENGEYEFLVKYKVVLENQQTKESVEKAPKQEAKTTDDKEAKQEVSKENLQETPKEAPKEIVREEEVRFKFTVDKIELPKQEEVKQQAVEEVKPEATPEHKEETAVVQEIEPLTEAPVGSGIQAMSAEPMSGTIVDGWYVVTQGNITIRIEGYDPTLPWVANTTKRVKISAIFSGENGSGRSLSINIPEGMKYVSHGVKENPRPGSPDYLIEGVLNGLMTTVVRSEKGKSNQYTGELTYNIRDTGAKSFETELLLTPNVNFLSLPTQVLPNGLTVTTKETGVANNELVQAFTVNNTVNFSTSSYSDRNSSANGTSGKAVEGGGKYDYARIETYRVEPNANQQMYMASVETRIPMPVEFKKENIEVLLAGAGSYEFDENNHELIFKTTDRVSTITPAIHFKANSKNLSPGTYSAENATQKITFGDGRVIDANYGKFKFEVVPASSIENKMNFLSYNNPVKFYSVDDSFLQSTLMTLQTDSLSERTNQTLEITIDKEFQSHLVYIPVGKSGKLSKIEYKKSSSDAVFVLMENQISYGTANNRKYAIVDKNSIGLSDSEFITYVKAKIGDFEEGYRSGSAYINEQALQVLGRLQSGKDLAYVNFETYATDSEEKKIDDTVASAKTRIESVNQPNVSFASTGDSVTIPAGTSTSATIRLASNAYHYNGNTTKAGKNATLYLKIPDGISYQNIKVKQSYKDLTTNSVVTNDLDTYVNEIKSYKGENYLEIKSENYVGDFFSTNKGSFSINVYFDINTSRSAVGTYKWEDLAFWQFDGDYRFGIEFGGKGQVSNIIKNNDVMLGTNSGSQITINSTNGLFIDGSIYRSNGSKAPQFDGTKETAIGFTTDDTLSYVVDIKNNMDTEVDKVVAYFPVPKEGYDFGSEIQSEEFGWNMKLTGEPDVKVFDKNGNDVSNTERSKYQVKFASIPKANAKNYRTEAYGNTFNDSTSMIRVENIAKVPNGHTIRITNKYAISETKQSIEAKPEKLGKVVDFRPDYQFAVGTNQGWDQGGAVGAYLSIGELKGRVFEDSNYNGKWETGERFLPNIKVVLYNQDGTKRAETTTQADGSYTFINLPSGKFTVDFANAINSDNNKYFTFPNEATGSEIGSSVPQMGEFKGKAINVDTTSENAKSMNVGVLDYDPTKVVYTVNPVTVREGNDQTPATSQQSTYAVNNVNYQDKLQAEGYPKYQIADTTLATVDANGLVTGVKAGTTELTITSKDIFGNPLIGKATVTVAANDEPTITFAPGKESLSLNKGDAYNNADGVTIQKGSEIIPVTDSRVTVTPNVDTSKVGVTEVTYKITTDGGNATASRLVAVTDETLIETDNFFIQRSYFAISSKDVANSEAAKETQVKTLGKVKAWNKQTKQVVDVKADVTQYSATPKDYVIKLTPTGAQGDVDTTNLKVTVFDGSVVETDKYFVMSKHGYATVKQVKDEVLNKMSATDFIDLKVIDKLTGMDKTTEAFIAEPYSVQAKEGEYTLKVQIDGDTKPTYHKVHVLNKTNLKVGTDYAIASNNVTYEQGVLTTKTDENIKTDAGVVAYARNNGSTVDSKFIRNENLKDVASVNPYQSDFVVDKDNLVSVTSNFTITSKSTDLPTIAATKDSVTVDVKKVVDNAGKITKEKVISDFGITGTDTYGAAITDPDKFTVTGLDSIDLTTIKDGYTLKVTVKDDLGRSSVEKSVKYVVTDTTKPTLNVEKNAVVYNTTKVNPVVPTLAQLEASGIFGTITKDDNDKTSTPSVMPLESADFNTVNFTKEGTYPIKLTIKDKSGNVSNELAVTIKVKLFDNVDPTTGWAMNASNFNAKLSEVQTAAGIISKANVKVYDTKAGEGVELNTNQYEVISNKDKLNVGEGQRVTLSIKNRATGNELGLLKKEVTANVYTDIIDGYAIVAHKFGGKVSEVQTPEAIIGKAGVKVSKIDSEKPNDTPTPITDPNIKIMLGTEEVTKLQTGVNQEVTFVLVDKDTVKATVKANIFDQTDGTLGLIANNFVTEKANVNTSAKIVAQASGKIYSVETGEVNSVLSAGLTATPSSLNVGNDQTVTISGSGLTKDVKADIHDGYDPTTGIAITANDTVTIAKNSIDKDRILELAEIKAWKYENGVRKEAITGIDKFDATPIPTLVGKGQNITYSVKDAPAAKTTKKIDVVETLITLTADKSIVLTVAEAAAIDSLGLVGKAHATATVDGRAITPTVSDADVNKVKAIIKGQLEPVSIHVTATDSETGDIATPQTVAVYVVDSFDPTSKIGITAENFAIELSRISLENYITEGKVKALDFNNLPNGTVDPIPSSRIRVNEDALKKETGERKARFTAVSGLREASIEVNANVFTSINGNVAINGLPTFTIAKSNVNEANLISQAGVKAWDITDVNNILPIDEGNIKVTKPTSLPTTAGDHGIEFTATKEGVGSAVFNSTAKVVESNIVLNADNYVALELEELAALSAETLKDKAHITASLAGDSVTIEFEDGKLDALKGLTEPNTNGITINVTAKAVASNDQITKPITVLVYNKIDTVSGLAINAHDFVIRLADVNEAKFKTAADVKAFDLSRLPNTKPASISDTKVKATKGLDKVVGDREVEFFAELDGAHTITIDVKASVVDFDDPTAKEGIEAHNFEIAQSEISNERVIEKSGATRVTVVKPGETTRDKNVTVATSPLPTTVGTHAVTLTTDTGVTKVVQMKVVKSNIKLVVTESINIDLATAKSLDDDMLIEKAGVSATHPSLGTTITFDQTAIDQINALTGGEKKTIDVLVTAKANDTKEPVDQTSKVIKVTVFDEIVGDFGIIAKDIVDKVANVNTKAKLITQSGVKVTNLKTNIDLPVTDSTVLFQVNGEEVTSLNAGTNQTVKISALSYGGIGIEINANIYDDVVDGLGIIAHNFAAQETDVDTEEKVVAEAKAMVFDAKTGNERPDLTVKTTNFPLKARDAKYMVTFTHNSLRTTSTAKIYKGYNPNVEEAINAYDFVIELGKVNEDNVKAAAKVKAFQVAEDLTETPIDLEDVTVSELPTTVGAHDITFTTPAGVEATVKANVVDKIDGTIAFSGHDFDIQLEDVTIEQFKSLSNIKAYDVSNVAEKGMVEITPELQTVLPTTTGTFDVTYRAIAGALVKDYTVKANVYDKINGQEAISANNFVVELNGLDANKLKDASGVKAYTLLGNGKRTEINKDLLTVTPIPTKTGATQVSFSTAKGTSIEVTANVVDKIENGIAFSGHDFAIELESVSDSEFVRLSEIKAYDVSNVAVNGMVEITPSRETALPTTVGTHPTTYKAVVGDRSHEYTVQARVYNKIDPTTSESLNAHDFVIQLADVNEANIKATSGLAGFTINADHSETTIELDDITVSAIPTTVGTHELTFATQAGTAITVKAYVVDKVENGIAFSGHDFDIQLSEVNKPEFARLSEVKAYDVADVVANGMVELTPELTTALPQTAGTHATTYTAKADTRSANFTINAMVYQKVDPTNHEAMTAYHFAIQLADVTEENLKTEAKLEAYKLTGNGQRTKIEHEDITVSPVPTTTGEHEITFTTQAGTTYKVTAHVVDKIENGIAFSGHDFAIKLADVSKEAFASSSEVKAYDVTDVANTGMVSLVPTLVTDLPTVIGNHDTTYKAVAGDRSLEYTVQARVYDEYNPNKKESINAHDFAIQLADFSEANVKVYAGLAAFTINEDYSETPIDLDTISVSVRPSTIQMRFFTPSALAAMTGTPSKVGAYEVTFTTAAGTVKTVTAYVVDKIDPTTQIAFSGHDFSVELDEVSIEKFAELSEIKAFDLSDVVNQGAILLTPELTTALPTTVGTHPATYLAKTTDGRELSHTVNANVHNVIHPDNKEAISAHDFAIELADVNDANVKAYAGLAAVTINDDHSETPIALTNISVSTLPTTVGTHDLTFTTAAGTAITVKAYVVDKIDPTTQIAFSGHDFSVELDEVSIEKFAELSEIKAFDLSDVVNQGAILLTPELTTALPTTVGTHPATYIAKTTDGRELSHTVNANVHNVIHPDNKEAISAHDFAIELADVNDANVKAYAGLAAVTINDDHSETPIALTNISVSTLPTTVGTHDLTFTTAAGTAITVKAYVVDKIDPTTQIAFSGHDFSVELDEVSIEKFAELSEVKAFDLSDVMNQGAILLTPELTTSLPTAVGTYDVTYNAKAGDRSLDYTVKANVHDHINPTTKEALNAHDFAIELADVNASNVKAFAGLEGFKINEDHSESPIALADIAVSELPTTVGQFDLTFTTQAGTEITVVATVVDKIDPTTQIAFSGHDFSVLLEEVSEAKFAELSEIKAYDVSDVVNNGSVALTPELTTTVPTTVGTHDVTYEAKAGSRTLDYTVKANVHNQIDPATSEALNAHDFVIKLEDVNDANVKALAELSGFTINADHSESPIALADIAV